MLHIFKEKQVKGIEPPQKFTWPFQYEPHPLCVIASEEVKRYIASREEWLDELQLGKMFGVLVVRDERNNLGFLAAFSGNLAGRNTHEYFVPPIFDALCPDGFFKTGEAQISEINHKIELLTTSVEFKAAQNHLNASIDNRQALLSKSREQLKHNKQLRARRRAEGEDESELIAESQHEKAELQRLKKRLNETIDSAQHNLDQLLTEIERLKERRKTLSYNLQLRLFEHYKLLNAKGEEKNLCEIFYEATRQLPPAGTGECAAPKLLQYAYQNNLSPIAMAEFWWGESPKGEIRRHGNFYPACISKCKPTLLYMMQGLDVDTDPMSRKRQFTPEILMEDDSIMVINKPSGMPSVDGKTDILSAESWAKKQVAGAMAVHRLDQATSGILVIAKDKDAHKVLQAQFMSRGIKKSYVALLDGVITSDRGEVSLPLKPDYHHRPCQMVVTDGKNALTLYELISIDNGKSRVRFHPVTGRTHQLRVHAAHRDGLATPIVGDELYGTAASRLCLHAEKIEFTHPSTGEIITIFCPPEF